MSTFDTSRFNKWTEEEEEFAVKNIFKLSHEELESKLGRSMNAIRKKLQMMLKTGKLDNRYRFYTETEDNIILENYGSMDIEKLEMLVFRTRSSIYSRITKLIGESKINAVSGDLIVSDLVPVMGYTKQGIRQLFKKTDIPFRKVNDTWVCDYESFWKWYKDNTQYMNPDKINYEDLYFAPEWYKVEVNKQKKELSNGIKRGTYTSKEISLAKYLKLKGYTYAKIANELNRTQRSVKEMFGRLRKIESYT